MRDEAASTGPPGGGGASAPSPRRCSASFQLLDQARVLLDVQRRGPHPRAGILLQPSHLAAEPFIHPESRGARADPVQRPNPGVLISRTPLREHRLRIRRAVLASPLRHDGSVTPARCTPEAVFRADADAEQPPAGACHQRYSLASMSGKVPGHLATYCSPACVLAKKCTKWQKLSITPEPEGPPGISNDTTASG